ncbi:hypothetical protein U3516DRAFT_767836 [Neocallimastix sp. 'constans']
MKNKENTSQEGVPWRISKRESNNQSKNPANQQRVNRRVQQDNRNPENQKEPKNHSKRKPERLHSSNQNPANKSVNWKSLKTFQKTG